MKVMFSFSVRCIFLLVLFFHNVTVNFKNDAVMYILSLKKDFFSKNLILRILNMFSFRKKEFFLKH